MLSELDTEAHRLITYLKLIDSKTTPAELQEVPSALAIDALKFQKWMLKALCGMLASGNFLIQGRGVGKVLPSIYLVDLLYSNEPWRQGVGLYGPRVHGQKINVEHGIEFGLILTEPDNQIAGINMIYWGVPFRGLFATKNSGHDLTGHKPAALRFVYGAVTREIELCWPSNTITSPSPVFKRS